MIFQTRVSYLLTGKHSAVSYQLSAISLINFKGEKSNFIKASEYEYLVENVVEIK
ncbi:MAG: hypothetical protein F6K17_06345 [Okeania sp. SIO3C4]|nr:hypothetical protein [Okeania sp. SIO3C4]